MENTYVSRVVILLNASLRIWLELQTVKYKKMNMTAEGAYLCCSNFRYVEPLEIERNANLIREM